MHLNYYPFSEMIAVIFPSDQIRNAIKHIHISQIPALFVAKHTKTHTHIHSDMVFHWLNPLKIQIEDT